MKFNATISQKYGPAMKITDQGKADEYFEICVRHNLRCRAVEGLLQDADEAIRIEKQNLGYYAGYYDNKTRERVERLFKCSHPVFGSIAGNGVPTVREALAAGALRAGGGKKIVARMFLNET